MIVRIMEEGQFDLSEADLDLLNSFDSTLERAIETGHEDEFRAALHDLLARVRHDGKPLPLDALQPSEVILPPSDASMEEVRAMLGDEGLIPDTPDIADRT
ncbi:PspA-associated protein PspAA [Salinactinospora qingdaonensis]|uniref:PspA-associated domain-containing protein n=1 Tax=Salinactinospora qingdaonensis TaxID=702744 RepID=A0ABP7FC71_9ACTN